VLQLSTPAETGRPAQLWSVSTVTGGDQSLGYDAIYDEVKKTLTFRFTIFTPSALLKNPETQRVAIASQFLTFFLMTAMGNDLQNSAHLPAYRDKSDGYQILIPAFLPDYVWNAPSGWDAATIMALR
jgi:hypothetical protein